jgi:hypothetical protein
MIKVREHPKSRQMKNPGNTGNGNGKTIPDLTELRGVEFLKVGIYRARTITICI